MNDNQQIDIITKWLGSGSINIFGLPFAGKDEQAKRFANTFSGVTLSGGEILRSSITPEIQSFFDAGELIPSDLYVEVVLPYLSKTEFMNKPLILSSVGRWHGEEDGVIKALKEANHELKAVIFLNISHGDAVKRLNASKSIGDRVGRTDDNEELLDTRFKEFEAKTSSVIDYYRGLNLLIEIDGSKSREEVQADILDALATKAQNS